MEASTAPRALAEARRGEKHDVEADPPGPRGVAHSLSAAAAAEPARRRCGGRRGGCAGSRSPHSVSSLSAQVSARPGFEDVSPGLPGAPAVPHAARATVPRTGRRLTLMTRSRPSGPFCSRWSADGQVKPPWDTHETRGSPVGLACACLWDRGNAPPSHTQRPSVLPTSLDPFQPPRRALLSTPRAFLSHGFVGTWLNPTCPWFLQFRILSRWVRAPKASLVGWLCPNRTALAKGPEQDEGAESLHLRYTLTLVDSPGASGGARGKQERAGHTVPCRVQTQHVRSRLLSRTEPGRARSHRRP